MNYLQVNMMSAKSNGFRIVHHESVGRHHSYCQMYSVLFTRKPRLHGAWYRDSYPVNCNGMFTTHVPLSYFLIELIVSLIDERAGFLRMRQWLIKGKPVAKRSARKSDFAMLLIYYIQWCSNILVFLVRRDLHFRECRVQYIYRFTRSLYVQYDAALPKKFQSDMNVLRTKLP